MTPIFFLGMYCVGLLLALFRHPIFGLYTYLFTFYMAPGDGWWRNDIPGIRYLMIAAIVAVVATLRLPKNTNRAAWYQTGAGKLIVLFVTWNWAQLLWTINFDLQLEGAVLYTKHMISFYLFYVLANSVNSLRNIAVAHIVGCAWFGYQALGAGGGRLETIGGAVAGANELGVHVSTGILFGGILILVVSGLRRWIVFGSMPLIANTLVLTLSRGSILGLVGGGVLGYRFIPKAIRKTYVLVGMLGLVLFGLIAHEPLINRIADTWAALTTDEVELDRSAAKRSDIAKAGLAIALDYPLGAGHRTTAVLSPQYMPAELLSRRSGVRSAHNTSAAIVAEHGFPGLLIYLLMILWMFRTIRTCRSMTVSGEDAVLLQAMAAFSAASLTAIYVSGNFSNNIDLETQFWCMALLASALELLKAKVAENSESTVASAQPHLTEPTRTAIPRTS